MYSKCRFKMNLLSNTKKNQQSSSQLSILFVICLIGRVICDSEDNDSIRNNNKGSIIPFTCPEDFGYYPHPTSCTQYYVCVFGSSILESCSKGLMYSKELQTCDWERNVKDGCGNKNNANTNNGTIGTLIVDPVNVINNPNPSDPQESKPDVTSDLTSNNLRNSRSYETELPDYKRELAYGEVPVGRLKRQANNYYHSSHPQRYNYNYYGGPTLSLDRQRQTNTNTIKPYTSHNQNHYHPQTQLIDIYNYGRGVQAQSLTTTMRPLFNNNYNKKIIKGQLEVQSSNDNDEDEYYYDDDDDDTVTDKNSISNQTDHTLPRSAAASSLRSNNFQFSREVVATTAPPTEESLPSNEDIVNQYYLVNQRYGESTTSNTPIYTNFDNSNTYPAIAAPAVQQPQPLANTNINRYNTKNTVSEPQYYQPQTHISQQIQQQPQPINLRPIYYNNSTYATGTGGSQTAPAVDYTGDYYYDYDDAPIVTTQRPTTTTSTTRAPKVIYSHSRGSATYNPPQQSQSQPTRTKSRVSPLPPKSKILAKASQIPVRNVYLDQPSRPEPVYETPEPGSGATKCKRSHCVIPDCNCGGTPIPGGLEANQIPQIVLLTFDDSVNDLNKDLYRDLFEKGRKNPNGCPIGATFYVSHEWTDYTQVQNLAADGHEIASHSITHSFGEQFSPSKWLKEVNGQREILSAYGGVKLNEIRGMRAPFLAIGGNNMFKMLYEGNFTYDSSMPVYENKPPSWPYTLDYKIFHDCMIPPCPTKSWPGVWEVPMVMWQDLKGGRCSMGDACSNPPTAEGVYEMLVKNFERHYTTNRAPFGLYYHAAWFTTPHHKEGFESFLDVLTEMDDVWIITNWQALQWIRSPTPLSQILSFQPWQCNDKSNIPPRCNSGKVCNLWHKGGVRYMKTCQPCPEKYPWVGSTGVAGNSL